MSKQKSYRTGKRSPKHDRVIINGKPVKVVWKFQRTIQLGNIARDKVTGFIGTVISRIEYLTGCMQFGLVGKIGPDGKIPHAEYFDHARLEYVSDGVAVKSTDTGGPQRDEPGR